jgi:hypothetical protein
LYLVDFIFLNCIGASGQLSSSSGTYIVDYGNNLHHVPSSRNFPVIHQQQQQPHFIPHPFNGKQQPHILPYYNNQQQQQQFGSFPPLMQHHHPQFPLPTMLAQQYSGVFYYLLF